MFALLQLFLTCGCTGTIASSPKVGAASLSARCVALDDRHALAGGVGKGSAVLGGGAGLSTIAVDDKTAKLSLAISSAVLAAIAAGSIYVSDQAASSFAEECR
jgi:hypothetical protein